jgi:hypothetical protein
MRKIFTAILPNAEACERFNDKYKDSIGKDYHLITFGSISVETPQFKVHTIDDITKQKINAKKYGRL